jgi:hypothetical protein
MSKHETPMLHWYWNKVGGTLVEEFKAVTKTSTTGQRLIDGIIILNQPKRLAHWSDVSIEGKDVIVVQVKRGRLGMYLMGQTFFSAKLIEKYSPNTIRSVAICEKYDSVLGPILESYEGMEVIIYQE